MIRLTVKVRADYEDGNYWLEKWRPLKDHPDYVWTYTEISIFTWALYRLHCWQARMWDRYAQRIDNAQYELEHEQNWETHRRNHETV